MRRIHIFLFFCLCILIYLIFAMFAITEPLTGDAIDLYSFAKIFNNTVSKPIEFRENMHYPHPPLYMHLLVFLDKITNLSLVVARLIGILSFIITLILIYAITQKIFTDNKNKYQIGLASIFLYAINPMVIQGSLLTFIDTTIMVPLLLFFVFIFFTLENKNRILILGIILAVLLWAKATTPIALLPTIFTFHLLRDNFKKAIKESCLVFFLGLFLFIVSWLFYCYIFKIGFLSPFLHYRNAILTNSSFLFHFSKGEIASRILRHLFRFILYITPFYFLLFMLAVWYRIREYVFLKRDIRTMDFLLFLSFIIFSVYFFVGGLYYSFPHLQYPFISLSVIISAGFIIDKIKFKKDNLPFYIFLLIAIIVYNVFLVGDFLYSSDYALRKSLIYAGEITSNILKNLIFQLMLYILPFLFISVILKLKQANSAFYGIVFVWIIASCLSMNILQARADYQTVYCYGGEGTKEAVSFINAIKSGNKSFIATKDIIFNIDQRQFLSSPDYYFIDEIFSSPERFISSVRNKKPDFIIYGISANTIEQYRKIFNNTQVVDFLKKDFIKKDIGSYSIWLKKGRYIRE